MNRHHELDQYDRERAIEHRINRMTPSRRSWPKDDRRSSSKLDGAYMTDAERDSDWPIG